MDYEFTQEMGEISGLGGGYEAACRAMLKAGLEWFDAYPDLAPEFQTYENIYGIAEEKNEHAKALTEAILEPVGGDCTGAMHQAVTSSLLWIRGNSWDAYVKVMSERGERTP